MFPAATYSGTFMLAWRQDPVRVEGVLERQVQPQRREIAEGLLRGDLVSEREAASIRTIARLVGGMLAATGGAARRCWPSKPQSIPGESSNPPSARPNAKPSAEPGRMPTMEGPATGHQEAGWPVAARWRPSAVHSVTRAGAWLPEVTVPA